MGEICSSGVWGRIGRTLSHQILYSAERERGWNPNHDGPDRDSTRLVASRSHGAVEQRNNHGICVSKSFPNKKFGLAEVQSQFLDLSWCGKQDTLKIDDGLPPEWTESTDFARTSVGQMSCDSLCDSRAESPEASSQRCSTQSRSSIGFAMPVRCSQHSVLSLYPRLERALVHSIWATSPVRYRNASSQLSLTGH